jgi:tRNA modification GTPase
MRQYGRSIFAALKARHYAVRRSFTYSVVSQYRRFSSSLLYGQKFVPVQNGAPLRPIITSRNSHFGIIDTIEDTIYALSTAPGRAAIAVIRISGPASVDIYKALCPGKPLPKPRVATIRALCSPITTSNDTITTTNDILDPSALILHFPHPHSLTGEDILELHLHGSPALIHSVLRAIPRCKTHTSSKIRPAEAGEFTRRAFHNDRLSLPQAEALGDLLSASTEQQRRRAVRGASDAVAERFERWRLLLLEARGELEAVIDFAEDQQFAEPPSVLLRNVTRVVTELRERLRVWVENAGRGELLRNGISVAIVGRPNAGKSSLLNLIVGREAAIVSPEMGTTRDILEVAVDLGGYLCRFIDTAGLRNSSTHGSVTNDAMNATTDATIGLVEQEGIRRAKQRALESDIVVVLLSYEPNSKGQLEIILDPEIMEMTIKCLKNGSKILIAINKSDLSLPEEAEFNTQKGLRKAIKEEYHLKDVPIIKLSCKLATADNPSQNTKSGLKSLMDNLIETFRKMTTAVKLEGGVGEAESLHLADTSEWEESLGGSDRQRHLLEGCASHLDSYLAQIYHPNAMKSQKTEIMSVYDIPQVDDAEIDIVLAAENLRAAADSLAKITGRGESGDVEEVLGVVFQK